MTFKKEKGNISPEGDLSFKHEIKTTHRRSLVIRIDLKSKRDGA
jgi:hypothetical protein